MEGMMRVSKQRGAELKHLAGQLGPNTTFAFSLTAEREVTRRKQRKSQQQQRFTFDAASFTAGSLQPQPSVASRETSPAADQHPPNRSARTSPTNSRQPSPQTGHHRLSPISFSASGNTNMRSTAVGTAEHTTATIDHSKDRRASAPVNASGHRMMLDKVKAFRSRMATRVGDIKNHPFSSATVQLPRSSASAGDFEHWECGSHRYAAGDEAETITHSNNNKNNSSNSNSKFSKFRYPKQEYTMPNLVTHFFREQAAQEVYLTKEADAGRQHEERQEDIEKENQHVASASPASLTLKEGRLASTATFHEFRFPEPDHSEQQLRSRSSPLKIRQAELRSTSYVGTAHAMSGMTIADVSGTLLTRHVADTAAADVADGTAMTTSLTHKRKAAAKVPSPPPQSSVKELILFSDDDDDAADQQLARVSLLRSGRAPSPSSLLASSVLYKHVHLPEHSNDRVATMPSPYRDRSLSPSVQLQQTDGSGVRGKEINSAKSNSFRRNQELLDAVAEAGLLSTIADGDAANDDDDDDTNNNIPATSSSRIPSSMRKSRSRPKDDGSPQHGSWVEDPSQPRGVTSLGGTIVCSSPSRGPPIMIEEERRKRKEAEEELRKSTASLMLSSMSSMNKNSHHHIDVYSEDAATAAVETPSAESPKHVRIFDDFEIDRTVDEKDAQQAQHDMGSSTDGRPSDVAPWEGAPAASTVEKETSASEPVPLSSKRTSERKGRRGNFTRQRHHNQQERTSDPVAASEKPPPSGAKTRSSSSRTGSPTKAGTSSPQRQQRTASAGRTVASHGASVAGAWFSADEGALPFDLGRRGRDYVETSAEAMREKLGPQVDKVSKYPWDLNYLLTHSPFMHSQLSLACINRLRAAFKGSFKPRKVTPETLEPTAREAVVIAASEFENSGVAPYQQAATDALALVRVLEQVNFKVTALVDDESAIRAAADDSDANRGQKPRERRDSAEEPIKAALLMPTYANISRVLAEKLAFCEADELAVLMVVFVGRGIRRESLMFSERPVNLFCCADTNPSNVASFFPVDFPGAVKNRRIITVADIAPMLTAGTQASAQQPGSGARGFGFVECVSLGGLLAFDYPSASTSSAAASLHTMDAMHGCLLKQWTRAWTGKGSRDVRMTPNSINVFIAERLMKRRFFVFTSATPFSTGQWDLLDYKLLFALRMRMRRHRIRKLRRYACIICTGLVCEQSARNLAVVQSQVLNKIRHSPTLNMAHEFVQVTSFSPDGVIYVIFNTYDAFTMGVVELDGAMRRAGAKNTIRQHSHARLLIKAPSRLEATTVILPKLKDYCKQRSLAATIFLSTELCLITTERGRSKFDNMMRFDFLDPPFCITRINDDKEQMLRVKSATLIQKTWRGLCTRRNIAVTMQIVSDHTRALQRIIEEEEQQWNELIQSIDGYVLNACDQEEKEERAGLWSWYSDEYAILAMERIKEFSRIVYYGRVPMRYARRRTLEEKMRYNRSRRNSNSLSPSPSISPSSSAIAPSGSAQFLTGTFAFHSVSTVSSVISASRLARGNTLETSQQHKSSNRFASSSAAASSSGGVPASVFTIIQAAAVMSTQLVDFTDGCMRELLVDPDDEDPAEVTIRHRNFIVFQEEQFFHVLTAFEAVRQLIIQEQQGAIVLYQRHQTVINEMRGRYEIEMEEHKELLTVVSTARRVLVIRSSLVPEEPRNPFIIPATKK